MMMISFRHFHADFTPLTDKEDGVVVVETREESSRKKRKKR